MKQVIVCTTINPPTKAIELFDNMPDWHLVVIGDKKTPKDYFLKNGTYLSPEGQEFFNKPLSDALGWNCIQRRNIGLHWAYEQGAEVIATVDDDNIPYTWWGNGLLLNKEVSTCYFETEQPVFDPLFADGERYIWHRGFPIELVPYRILSRKVKNVTAQIQADLWNGDPDVDAICRMEHAPSNCDFSSGAFPMASNQLSPFNSQNTFLSREVVPHYFMFPGIGRMDDIWAGYYVQALGYKVIYNSASVVQVRNNHNLIQDMKAEYIGYENNLALVNDLKVDPERIYKYLPESSAKAFRLYRECFL